MVHIPSLSQAKRFRVADALVAALAATEPERGGGRSGCTGKRGPFSESPVENVTAKHTRTACSSRRVCSTSSAAAYVDTQSERGPLLASHRGATFVHTMLK